MNAKVYLQQISEKEKYIAKLLDELKYYQEMSQSVKASSFEKNMNTQRNVDDATFVFYLRKIDELKEKVDNAYFELQNLILQVNEMIDSLDNYDERNVIRNYYIRHLKWKDIAKKMGYSLSWIYKLHESALNNLNKIVQNSLL